MYNSHMAKVTCEHKNDVILIDTNRKLIKIEKGIIEC